MNKIETLPSANDVVKNVELNNIMGLAKITFIDPWTQREFSITVPTVKE